MRFCRTAAKRWKACPLLFALIVLPICSPLVAAAPEQVKTVVFLYPDGYDGRPGNYLVDQGVRSAFKAGSAERIVVLNEYLDLSRPLNDGYRQQLVTYLQRKYAGRKIDLLMAGLAPALDFALEHRDQLFPGVPLVFCAVDQRELKSRKLPHDVVGIPATFDLAATLDLILRLQPATRRIFLIAGSSPFDAQWVAQAQQAFHGYEGKLEFVYLTGLPTSDLAKKVAQLPDKSVIYYLHVFQDSTGKALVPGDVLEQVAASANAPVYSHVDSFMGRGIVGGHLFSFEAEGKNAANIGLRILAGEEPGTFVTPEAIENTYMFDWRQLRRWGISEENLPPGSIVRHKTPDFWDLYRWHAAVVLTFCVLQGLLIVGLLVQRARRRRADVRFRQVVEAAPNGMLMVGRNGLIVLANAQMEKLFGYQRAELLGRPVEMLVPERFRKQHPAQRDHFFELPGIRLIGAGRDLFAQRKDGSEFPVEVGLSPVQTDFGLCVLALVIDITERRRAELALRESEGRFRLMADTAPVMVWMSGPDKLCTYFNKPWLDFTGRPLERELGHGWSEGVHTDDLQRCMETYVRAVDARREFQMEYRLRRFDGEYRWLFDLGVPRFHSDGTFEGFIGSCVDITDRMGVEQALRENQRELRALNGRFLQAQEIERRRIARDLHDDLSQSLALLAVELDLLGQAPPEMGTQLTRRMNELSARVKLLSSAVHGLSHNLHPSKLEQLGLVASIRGLCKEHIQAHGLSVEFSHERMPPSIPEDTVLCLYRITQEALRNVIKHSRALHARVELCGDEDGVSLRIVDDGVGFDLDARDGGEGLGLVSMRERLHLVGGTIVIDSRPSEGTRIDVHVPLRTADNGTSAKTENALPRPPFGSMIANPLTPE